MKKGIKATLIVATICLVLGMVMTGAAFVLADVDIRNLSTAPEYQEKSQNVSAKNVSEITFKGTQENITVQSYEGKDIQFEHYESDDLSYTVEENNGSLKITETRNLVPKFFYFDFEGLTRSATLKIPTSFKGSLNFTTQSGGITVRDIEALDKVTTASSSGKVLVEQVAFLKELAASSNSGAVVAINMNCDSLALSSLSGNVDVHGVEVYDSSPQAASIESKSGSVFIDDTKAPTLQAETSSGRLTCEDVKASTLKVGASSGSISLQQVYADTLSGNTNSGNMDILLVGGSEEYLVSATSRSGMVSIPSAGSEKLPSAGVDKHISLESGSGRIYLEFTKDYA